MSHAVARAQPHTVGIVSTDEYRWEAAMPDSGKTKLQTRSMAMRAPPGLGILTAMYRGQCGKGGSYDVAGPVNRRKVPQHSCHTCSLNTFSSSGGTIKSDFVPGVAHQGR